MKRIITYFTLIGVALVFATIGIVDASNGQKHGMFKSYDAAGNYLGMKKVEINPIPTGFERVVVFDPVTHNYLGTRDVLSWNRLSPDMRQQAMTDTVRGVFHQLLTAKGGDPFKLGEAISRIDKMPIFFGLPDGVQPISGGGGVSTEASKPMIVDPGGGATCTQGSPGCPYDVCGNPSAVCPGAPGGCHVCG